MNEPQKLCASASAKIARGRWECECAYWDLPGGANRELVECRKVMAANNMRRRQTG
jgi:hypothetical protein